MAEFNITNGVIFSPIETTPVPSDGGAYLFAKSRATRIMYGQVGPSGIDYTFQPALYANKVAYWNPPGNATTAPGVFGLTTPTATGTATTRNVATTNLFTRTKRVGTVSSATANNVAGYRVSVAQFTLGTGTLGGFSFVIRFGISDASLVANARMFVGLRNTTTAPTNVDPGTITNCIGVGHSNGDTNLFLYYGGSAAQTPIDLGSNFPTNTTNTDLYELMIFANPYVSGEFNYRVERLGTNFIAEGTVTGTPGTQIPNSTTLLTHNSFRTNNTTASAVGLDFISIYFETDY